MDINDKLSEKIKNIKGDEELDLLGFLVEFTWKGKGIFQIRQGLSEASLDSKGLAITIEHITSALLSTIEVSRTYTTEETSDK